MQRAALMSPHSAIAAPSRVAPSYRGVIGTGRVELARSCQSRLDFGGGSPWGSAKYAPAIVVIDGAIPRDFTLNCQNRCLTVHPSTLNAACLVLLNAQLGRFPGAAKLRRPCFFSLHKHKHKPVIFLSSLWGLPACPVLTPLPFCVF